jgi:acetyl esterase/lipase
MDKEGEQVAAWLNSLGVTAFVLKYRLGPSYHHPIELGDAQRAIRTVRFRAAEYRVDPARIGIMGFSAGGHLASTAGTHFDAGIPGAADPIDRIGSRPDFLVLCYPVISLHDPYAHVGSRVMLLGNAPDPTLVDNLSNESQVTAETPPTFLFHTANDRTVPVENSVNFFLALRKAGVPAEMHIYESGPHGVGLAATDATLSSWPARLEAWLRSRGLLNAAAK